MPWPINYLAWPFGYLWFSFGGFMCISFGPKCDGSPAINYKTDTGFSRIYNRHRACSCICYPHTHTHTTLESICICAYINDKYFDRIWFLMRFCAHSLRHFALRLFIWGISFRSLRGLHNLSTRIKAKNYKTDNRKQILMNIIIVFFNSSFR